MFQCGTERKEMECKQEENLEMRYEKKVGQDSSRGSSKKGLKLKE